MKTLFLAVIYVILCYAPQTVSAQAISVDSVIAVALSTINNDLMSVNEQTATLKDYNKRFYIKDVATGQLFAGEKNGIYEFALFGDDLPLWIMWQDSTGYKVYFQKMDIEMLGEILEFCRRNKYPPEKSLRYLEGVYKILYPIEIPILYKDIP